MERGWRSALVVRSSPTRRFGKPFIEPNRLEIGRPVSPGAWVLPFRRAVAALEALLPGRLPQPAPTTPARSSIACSSTLQPAVMCSGWASSISLWLMPSLHGMKIIPAGASRAM